jgi:hypothetical protein
VGETVSSTTPAGKAVEVKILHTTPHAG